MLWTLFHHPHLTIPLDDVRLYFAYFFVEKLRPIGFAARDRFTSFFDTLRAERIGLPRPTQDRLGLLPGLQKRFFRPFRRERRVGIEPVKVLDRVKRHTSPIAQRGIEIFHDALAQFRFDLVS